MSSSKPQKVSLAGVVIRQRKRDVKTIANPTGFKETLSAIVEQSMAPDDVFKLCDQYEDELDFRRYDEYFWDLFLAGGTGACIGKFEDDVTPINQSFFGIEKKELPKPQELKAEIVTLLREFVRRKPFLEPTLQKVIEMLLNSSSLLEEKYQTATKSLVAHLLACRILRRECLQAMLRNEAAIESGQMLQQLTGIFKALQTECNQEVSAIVKLLNEGKIMNRLMDFFPSPKRTPEAFAEHWKKEGLQGLLVVAQNIKKKEQAQKIKNMVEEFVKRRNEEEEDYDEDDNDENDEDEEEDEAAGSKKKGKGKDSATSSSVASKRSAQQQQRVEDAVNEFLAELTELQDEVGLDGGILLSSIFEGLMLTIDWKSKKASVKAEAAAQVVRKWGPPLMKRFAEVERADDPTHGGAAQLSLMQCVQNYCYEKSPITKEFVRLVHILYMGDVIEEDVIREWSKKGVGSKGKDSFKKQIVPLIEWLDIAPEKSTGAE
ncbi:putative translation factor [Monocercomonoides exilis]|uniref:putative translation factor n=1 Tax=Monocercomonoides exilis TaxID=2049356 RepID=UPI00355AA5BC|nr:putative translation factor [Monocercomonoides exilis]|eukprot:MONOS_14090.1-p1 / transcript=MONOS_14090.1 / gene=MONOS_14090 / organism=Monocercomonoides_exilis_PA203 / gene_product=TPA_inf / transcript_product=TPA_inf / location=Mono_scaffold00935:2281-3952(-) / protein_length=488 / sequence_SO=supercontig / SO=protein_coding / is_pseudo=false